jgi:hypothetical protein
MPILTVYLTDHLGLGPLWNYWWYLLFHHCYSFVLLSFVTWLCPDTIQWPSWPCDVHFDKGRQYDVSQRSALCSISLCCFTTWFASRSQSHLWTLGSSGAQWEERFNGSVPTIYLSKISCFGCFRHDRLSRSYLLQWRLSREKSSALFGLNTACLSGTFGSIMANLVVLYAA